MTNKVIHGDNLEVLKTYPENYFHSVVTDPPYGLKFMNKHWDYDVPQVEFWREVLRVLKPGGYVLSFGGTRTYHRMVVNIEDAGFIIRDQLQWIYGQGFPKSLNIFKDLKKRCQCGNLEAYENRIQQAGQDSQKETEYFLRFMQEANLSEKINFAKEQGEVLQSGLPEQSTHGTVQREKSFKSFKNGKQSRLERGSNLQKTEGELQRRDICKMPERVFEDGEKGRLHNATSLSDGTIFGKATDTGGSSSSHRPQSEQQPYKQPCSFCKQWGTQAARGEGYGTALKPANEPICLAMKPLSEKNFAENVLKHGAGGLNIDGCRVGESGARRNGGKINNPDYIFKMKQMDKEDYGKGRFPSNVILDEEAGGMLNGEARFFYCSKASSSERNAGMRWDSERGHIYPQNNSVERKELNATACERVKNHHATVKPLSLMRYLVRLVTPKGGIVLEPFAGSGTTLLAAKKEGFEFVGIERELEYCKIAEQRLESVAINEKLF
jgi:DNA modification methylase